MSARDRIIKIAEEKFPGSTGIASGEGVRQTVRSGPEIIAASHAYSQLLGFKGKVRFSRTLAELKADR